MERADALVVGGGPAGSTCAWALLRAGLDVLLLDRARFPRDKVCGGWLTPQAVSALDLDLDDYARGRVLQAIRGARTRRIGGPEIETRYREVVSYGIRRCELDDYLLRRSGARVRTGAIWSLRREKGSWLVNEAIRTPLLVGAGGHFCPVARALGAGPGERPVVAAQEVELRMSASEQRRCLVDGELPELFFCPDLEGYGWIFRKADHLNVGFGRRDTRAFPQQLSAFSRFLTRLGRVPFELPARWAGHAYLLYDGPGRKIVDDGVLLVGDAAGLAYSASGEGIRPAIESGLLAAEAILAAGGRRERADLEPYAGALEARFGPRRVKDPLRLVPGPVRSWLGGYVLGSPLLSRRLVLDRWFFHRQQPALAPASVRPAA